MESIRGEQCATDFIANMNQRIVKIARLSKYSNSELENVTIKASVSIRSLRHGNSRHAHFYMDLRDDSGDITAVAYTHNEPGDDQLHTIQDNRTYMITNFSLTTSNKRYTSIPNEKEIVLNNKTVVKLCGNAPKFEWSLTPLHQVYGDPKLFNIVGLCIEVTKTKIVHGQPTRIVTLVDEEFSEVFLHVWNQETSLFDELDLYYHPVLFVKDARIYHWCQDGSYEYPDTTSVSTSRYLQLLHPDDRRAAKIRRAMPRSPPNNDTKKPNLIRRKIRRKMVRLATNKVLNSTAIPLRTNSYCTLSNVTKSDRKYVTIADLASITDTSSVSDATVIATVTIKSIRFTQYGDVYFCMDLRDESGEIVAAVYDDACVKFQNFIEKNNTYSFTGVSLRESNRLSTSITHQRMLVLEYDSEAKLCGSAPKVEWPLSPLTVVHAGDQTEFFQAFGLCTRIEGRVVTLTDQLGRELFLEVGDEYIAMFDALDLKSRPVFFVKDAKMSDNKYKGSTLLVTGKYLELLEPDDPRAQWVPEALGVQPAGSNFKHHDDLILIKIFSTLIFYFVIVDSCVLWLQGKHIIQYVMDLVKT